MGWNFLEQQPRVHLSHLDSRTVAEVDAAQTGPTEIAAGKTGHIIRVVYAYIQIANTSAAGKWELVEKTASPTVISPSYDTHVENAAAPIPEWLFPPSAGWFETSTAGDNLGIQWTALNVPTASLVSAVFGYVYVRSGVNVGLLDKAIT